MNGMLKLNIFPINMQELTWRPPFLFFPTTKHLNASS